MEPFVSLTAQVVPLNRQNVDTDAIIPKQFLKSVARSGFGPYLFDSWRYLDVGEPGMDCQHRPINSDFVLNHPRYQKAQILLTRDNFGCGSSREHAPWALYDYGFRAILAPSFADIFFNNSFKNGLLLITLSEDIITRLIQEVEDSPNPYTITIDLPKQIIHTQGREEIAFSIDGALKHRLLNGLDDIGLTLQHTDWIRAYEARRRQEAPWLFV